MAAKTGTTAAAVREQLLANGEKFSYFQAIRLLRLLGKSGGMPHDALRIRPKLGLGFPENDIDRIEALPQGGYRITANFFGLYGVASPLPVYYTEDLFEEEREGRHATRDFLDIVHHAMYPLLFDAWIKYRLQQRIVEADDGNVLDHLYAFVGLGNPDLRIDLLPGSAELLRYAGLLNQRPRSALGLRTLLADAFSPARVEINSCVPHWLPIPSDQRLRLGRQAHCLGEDTHLGQQIDDHTNQIRVRLHDVPADLFHQLLPGEAGHARLCFLTRYYLLDPLTVRVQISLRDGAASPARLNSRNWSRLGLDTWLNPEADGMRTRMAFSL
ncbi:MAG TPA: type VI secretion system baseplate subunit TssG [Burkholderiaceae bacterium]|nr:type VI secretion system baseplate subunit TssG [Burkholderiaceae bacterium]